MYLLGLPSMMLSDPYTPTNPLELYLLTIKPPRFVFISSTGDPGLVTHQPRRLNEVYSLELTTHLSPQSTKRIFPDRPNPSSLLLSSDLAPDENPKIWKISPFLNGVLVDLTEQSYESALSVSALFSLTLRPLVRASPINNTGPLRSTR